MTGITDFVLSVRTLFYTFVYECTVHVTILLTDESTVCRLLRKNSFCCMRHKDTTEKFGFSFFRTSNWV